MRNPTVAEMAAGLDGCYHCGAVFPADEWTAHYAKCPEVPRCATFDPTFKLPPREPLPSPWPEFGRELRALREKHDISMGELARMLGCNVARLSDVETGSRSSRGSR